MLNCRKIKILRLLLGLFLLFVGFIMFGLMLFVTLSFARFARLLYFCSSCIAFTICIISIAFPFVSFLVQVPFSLYLGIGRLVLCCLSFLGVLYNNISCHFFSIQSDISLHFFRNIYIFAHIIHVCT